MESLAPGGKDSHAPIGRMIHIGELVYHCVGFFRIEQTKPHRYCRQHAGLGHFSVLLVQAESKDSLLGNPKGVVQKGFLPREFSFQLFLHFVVGH